MKLFKQTVSQAYPGRQAFPWIALLAAAWAFVFAAMSFYWAAGGTVGAVTLSPDLLTLGQDPWFGAAVWGTGALKGVAGVLALALVQRWGRRFPRSVNAIWGIGGFMVLYAGANLAVRAPMALEVLETPASMRSEAARWHLLFWDPWWPVGGLLFCLAAWTARRSGGQSS